MTAWAARKTLLCSQKMPEISSVYFERSGDELMNARRQLRGYFSSQVMAALPVAWAFASCFGGADRRFG